MTGEAPPGLFGILLLPGVVLMAAGVLLFFLKGHARAAVALAAPAAVLALAWLLPAGFVPELSWLGYTVVPFRADALSRLFTTVFAIAAFAGALFALGQTARGEIPVAFLYAGAAIGVVSAGDLLTVFVLWETMAVASTVLILLAGPAARDAGLRYIVVHLLGGVLLMAGIAGHVAETGSIAFEAMRADSPARWLMLAGFLVNAAAWPLSVWVADAYPRASWSGMVFLSAFTTKTAVYVLLRGFPGEEALIPIGLAMVVYGTVYAILENDMRRLLAYSIVDQVGFMVTAIGIGSAMALNGAAAHAFVHILYKALLLMAAGSVVLMTGRSRLTELGGLARTMPLTAACAAIGALSIAAFPLTSGFIAKPLITDAAAAAHLDIAYLILTAASAAVLLHAGLRFPWFVFLDRDSGLRPAEPPAAMRAAMILCATLCIGIGLFPSLLTGLLPFGGEFAPYAAAAVVSKLQLGLAGALVFFLALRFMRSGNTLTLDADWLWRRPGRLLARDFDGRSDRAWARLVARSRRGAERFLAAVYRAHGPAGILARSWPTGSMAFWAVFLLGAYLVLYYL